MREFLSGLFEVSLTMGAVTALLLVLSPVWKRRFRPQWRCRAASRLRAESWASFTRMSSAPAATAPSQAAATSAVIWAAKGL